MKSHHKATNAAMLRDHERHTKTKTRFNRYAIIATFKQKVPVSLFDVLRHMNDQTVYTCSAGTCGPLQSIRYCSGVGQEL